jgi:GGDEF domain-containing protein
MSENGNGNGSVLSRTCYLNGWKRVGLELEEVKAIEEAVRRKNVETLRQSLKDTFTIAPEDCFDINARVQMGVALFEARRIHLYTALKEAVDTKVFQMKEQAREAREMMKASQPSPIYG